MIDSVKSLLDVLPSYQPNQVLICKIHNSLVELLHHAITQTRWPGHFVVDHSVVCQGTNVNIFVMFLTKPRQFNARKMTDYWD